MFKNKIALKLAGYFAICLLVFSIIIGGVFMVLLKNQTTQLYKADLEKRALSIAETLGSFSPAALPNGGGGQHGGQGNQNGYGAYLRFLDDIAMTDIWLIDQNFNIITRGQGHQGSENIVYQELPAGAELVISQVFSGQTAFSEDFSDLLNQRTITVGTPIKNGETVVGAVLLHSPIAGTQAAVRQGLTLLAVSLAVALLLALLLALGLSKSFTDPIISKEAAEALRLEKLRRDFVANISHELKTPVAVIRGSLEALVDQVVTEPVKVDAYHREMLTETLYLQRLVGDLLDLSRLQNTDFKMEMQDLNPADLLADAVRSVEHLAREKGITVTLAMQDLPAKIYGDYGRLRQMLLIILDNAVKFSPDGANIEVTMRGSRLTVRDHGVGITPAELPYLFDRFYKSPTENNKTGSGLGLPIAKQIAERHQLQISADNAADGGAIITIDLA